MGEGEGGMIWESSIETFFYITIYEIDHQSRVVHETGRSGPVHWDDPEGGDWEGGGRGVQDGGHMYTYDWVMSMRGKKHYNTVISLQLK